jgi:hypothetical protein
VTVRTHYFELSGGLDLVTPWLKKKAGALVAAQNYECAPGGGYRAIEGYRLYDGTSSPDVPAAVPGSGPIRGVHVLNGEVFAFRDNALGTAGDLYKATAAGWVLQALGSTISFTTGTAAIAEGNTVTGGTSGATATVRRIMVTAGSWGGAPSASGRLTLYGITGTFQNGENLQVGGATKAVASSVATANTLPAGGRYECVSANFYGNAASRRMYGANGVGTAFEWTGAYFTPIQTGASTDTPRHVIAHSDHLFLGYAAGSVVFSSLGEPLIYDAASGAGELALGDEVVGLHAMPGNVLALRCAGSIHLLYGNNASDFQRKTYSLTLGGRPYTGQALGETFFLDGVDIVGLVASQNFGDFATGTVSKEVEPLLKTYAPYAVASMACRKKSQYRLFFNGGDGDFAKGYGLYMLVFGGKVRGVTPVRFADAVRCTAVGEDSTGDEILFFGSDDGKVFQLDVGLDFNGTACAGFLRLTFNHFGSPTNRKRFRQAIFDMVAEDTVHLYMTVDFDYADPDIASHQIREYDQTWGTGGLWDDAKWDEFYWDAKLVAEMQMDIAGTGHNMALMIYSPGDSGGIHSINGVVVHYSDRRLVR